jgi:hypothetical protein
MNRSRSAVSCAALVVLLAATRTEAAPNLVATIDDFQTSSSGSGQGILGTRTVLFDSVVSPSTTWSQSLDIGGGMAASRLQVSTASQFPNDGWLSTILMYTGFGTVDLTNAVVKIKGQVSQSVSGGGITSLFLAVDSDSTSAELPLEVTTSLSHEWLLDFSSFNYQDLSTINRFRLFARAYCAGGGTAELTYHLTQFEIVAVPAPAAAPLLALAGLTARSRRRR